MKSKIRKIVVQGKTYVWNVKQIDPNYICLRIWANAVKSIPWLQFRYRFDDPWLHFGELITGGSRAREVLALEPLKPKSVAEIIERVLRQYGEPGSGFRTINLEMSESIGFVEVTNALLPGTNPFE